MGKSRWTLGGAMLWTKPARLAPFTRESPFFDLNLPDDVTISRQVLAEPSPDLGEKSWARLTDGTPLVTASPLGDGWIVLVHTTSNAAWSNLALSGLFLEMLERIVGTSRGVAGAGQGERRDTDRAQPSRTARGRGSRTASMRIARHGHLEGERGREGRGWIREGASGASSRLDRPFYASRTRLACSRRSGLPISSQRLVPMS